METCSSCKREIYKAQVVDFMGVYVRHRNREDCVRALEAELAASRDALAILYQHFGERDVWLWPHMEVVLDFLSDLAAPKEHRRTPDQFREALHALNKQLAASRQKVARVTAELESTTSALIGAQVENKRIAELLEGRDRVMEKMANHHNKEVARLKADAARLDRLEFSLLGRRDPYDRIAYLPRDGRFGIAGPNSGVHYDTLRQAIDAALPAPAATAATCPACIGGHTEHGFQDCEKCGGTGKA